VTVRIGNLRFAQETRAHKVEVSGWIVVFRDQNDGRPARGNLHRMGNRRLASQRSHGSREILDRVEIELGDALIRRRPVRTAQDRRGDEMFQPGDPVEDERHVLGLVRILKGRHFFGGGIAHDELWHG
jgi:hypothetical protein